VPTTPSRPGSNSVARAALRARVGTFVRQRRRQLGLRLVDVTRALGYKSLNAISNVESGIEGVPAKRAYAWAEVLEVPRDAFFRFVIGDTSSLDATVNNTAPNHLGPLSGTEQALIASYRRLPRPLRVQLRARARELEAIAGSERRRRR
jgi:transcriptional regulator with XRE-family HTH domain